MDRFRPYFSFEGRANRQCYWVQTLTLYGMMLVCALGLVNIPGVGPFFGGVIILMLAFAGLALAVRRLHDRNKSGWRLLVFYLPIGVLSALSGVSEVSNPEAALAFAVLSLPFSIWALVELGFLKGTTGANRFGPDPLNPSSAELFS